MLLANSHGDRFFGADRDTTSLLATQRWAFLAEARSAHGPEIRRHFRETEKVQKGREPAQYQNHRHDWQAMLRATDCRLRHGPDALVLPG